ncbi:MAG: Phosphoenolpyruvate synthase [Candidatus Anoxychlamydiales bacterium]|nr:Phosphoenolpyruvate synthase [Candidatus Anoxychlamydiales bacterium]
MQNQYILWFDQITANDLPSVGGKNASLGEMLKYLKDKNINVPNGFALTAKSFWTFIEHNNLKDKLQFLINRYKEKKASLQITGKAIRKLILRGKFPKEIQKEIVDAYLKLSSQYNRPNVDVAIRSSATAEDLPSASFAGQLESFLNIKGKNNILKKCVHCYASLFTDRAIIYREEKGFDHMQIAVSVGIQKMVRSDMAGAGVIFTLDTESGFSNVIEISAAFGLGENVVQGTITPDEYITFKPLVEDETKIPILQKKMGRKEKKMIYSPKGTKNIRTTLKQRESFVLTDKEILILSRWAKLIEDHYKKPMDIEWAKDGPTNELFIVQARPETVQAQKERKTHFSSYKIPCPSQVIIEGLAIGEKAVSGKAQIIKSIKDINRFEEGSILVTKTTSPDWVPIMKKAKGIITDLGGRTSHAAIVSRELNVAAIVGTINATTKIKDGQEITLSCAEGSIGKVYDKILEIEKEEIDIEKLPKIKTNIMINIASSEGAFHWWHLPVKGIGLARLEFIINNIIKIHPMALVHFDKIKNAKTKNMISKLTKGYKDKSSYFVDTLAYSVAKIAASQYPNDVIVRMSDFKTNEYFNLIGGDEFEFKEENPMLGFRGASRYYNKKYVDGFKLECRAIKKAREIIGLDNIIIMIPFCRTLDEADKVLKILKDNDLSRGENNLKVYVMAEIPSNIILADKFATKFDGFSIGSNDLTQLTLGIDRDSEELSSIFDENNEAVKISIAKLIKDAHSKNAKVGICGQAPSDKLEFAKFLVQNGIDSISLNPDSVIKVINYLSKIEKK